MRDWNSMNIQGNVQLRLIDTKLLFSMLGKADSGVTELQGALRKIWRSGPHGTFDGSKNLRVIQSTILTAIANWNFWSILTADRK